ncbi:MAG: VanZ family protein [Steroidobacteraceae bacterium]
MSIAAPGLRYGRSWFIAGVVLAALITIASLLPAQKLPTVAISDKVEHVIAFAVLAFWFGSVIAHRDFFYLALALVAFGAAIEIAQGAMGLGRQSDIRDLVADCIGMAGGLALAWTPLGSWASLIDKRIAARRAR